MRKILYVLASPVWGGGEQYVRDLMRSLDGNGYECYAAAPHRGTAAAKLCETVPPERVSRLRLGSMFDMVSTLALARIIRRKRINMVHVNKFSDAFLALWARGISRRRVRIVMTRHLIRRGKTTWPYTLLYRRLDRLIFVSELARREFLSRGAKIDAGKVSVIRNGIPDLPEPPSRDKSGEGAATMAFVGRVVEEKGLDVLMEALAQLREYDFRMNIIGSGPQEYSERLKNMAEWGGFADRLSFTGFTDDVASALRDAEIGILPSVVREGFPIAVLEYMRSGLAVVASDNGGQAECLTEGTDALLVPPGDRKALAGAIETLLADPRKRREMGGNARKTFLAGLTYDRFLSEITKIYDGLCG